MCSRLLAGLGLVVLTMVALPRPATVSATGRCGVERWAVKTGTDQDAAAVDLGRVTATTVLFLRSEPAPGNPPAYSRVAPVETTQWSLDATLIEFKAENDSDYHLVLADASGRTLIAEVVDPGCVASASPFRPAITRARAEFENRYLPSSSFAAVNIPVRIQGIGFFDFHHGQTGVAPNAVELHPVTGIVFYPAAGSPTTAPNPGSSDPAPAFTSPAAASSVPAAPAETPAPPTRGPGWFTAAFAMLVLLGIYAVRLRRRPGR